MTVDGPAMPTSSVRWLGGLVLLACAVLVAAGLAELRLPAIVAKLVASSAFIGVAIAAGALASRYGRVVLAALVCSWLGDALLLGRTEALFLAGLGAFLLAHVCYVAAFAIHGIRARFVLLGLLPVALASAVALRWLGPYVPEPMQLPVWVYTFVISAMVAMALGTRGAGGPLLIPVGAVLFYLSDLSVAAGQFVRPEFPNFVWGLPFYYVGQLLLALSVASTSRRS
jgi:uncharacterized membrane protein YhhN